MAVPNHFHVVQAVFDRWPLTPKTDAEIGAFTEACAIDLHAVDARWGHLKKNPGSTQYNGHAVNAVLYLSDTPGQSTAVDIYRMHDPDVTGPRWLVDVPRYSPSDWYAPAGQPAPKATPLGVSFFCALGLRRLDRGRYNEFQAFHRDVLQPNYVREFYYLAEGPWGLVGTGHLGDQERDDLLVACIEDLLALNIKPQLTVFGTWVPDEHRRLTLVDRFLRVTQPYASRLFLVDCVNEPGPIGFPYSATREVGRRLAGAGYPLLSLASPDTLHGGVRDGDTWREATDAEVAADTSRLYGGMPAAVNAITPHWGRKPWHPHRPLGPDAAGRTIVNDEPRGYKSSVDEIRDAASFQGDYSSSSEHREPYTLHGEPGIWAGYCDTTGHPEWAHNNTFKRWTECPGIDDIVQALHQVRAGGVDTGGGNGGGGGVKPYPGDEYGWQIGEVLFADYAEFGQAPNPGMGVWFWRTAWDAATTLTVDASIEKHRAEWRAELEKAQARADG